MSAYIVVDASFAIKWVFRESDSAEALALAYQWAQEGRIVIAPALFVYEITNIVRKQMKKAQLSLKDAQGILKEMYRRGPAIEFSVLSDYQEMSLRSLEIAETWNLPAAYDAQYVALAEAFQCQLWTADAALWNTIQGGYPDACLLKSAVLPEGTSM